MRPEELIEVTACRKILDELGVDSLKLNVQGRIGYPDRQFFVPGGKPTLIEFKDIGEDPDPMQFYIHSRLRQLGYHIEVHDNVADAFNCIAKALHTAQVSNDSDQVSP